MKKIFAICAIFAALLFVVSCSDSKKSDEKTDNDVVDTEPETPDEDDPATDDDENTESADEDDNGEPAGPCNPNPCESIANSTKECETENESYKCGCKYGYKWTGSFCVSISSSSLPECSTSSDTPCVELTSGLIWSAKSSDRMDWDSAMEYCNGYSEGELSGWRLPNINELRTLINNCGSVTDGPCAVKDPDCLSHSCWSDDCYCDVLNGTIDGYYSKLGDNNNILLWSSSTRSDSTSSAWYVYFEQAYVNSVYKSTKYSVRCVR
ncbi:DUF1566 domain-containing protein [bacterium]|nr:DUF1566 domain-containing protein [bacterium]